MTDSKSLSKDLTEKNIIESFMNLFIGKTTDNILSTEKFKKAFGEFMESNYNKLGGSFAGEICFSVSNTNDPIIFNAINKYVCKKEFNKFIRHFTAPVEMDFCKHKKIDLDIKSVLENIKIDKSEKRNKVYEAENDNFNTETGYGENTLYLDVVDEFKEKTKCIIKVIRQKIDSGLFPSEKIDVKILIPNDNLLEITYSAILKNFIKSAIDEYTKPSQDKLVIWRLTDKLIWYPMKNYEELRELDTIVLDEKIIESIKLKLNNFKKLNCLFYGPAGTGKTSLARAVASFIKKKFNNANQGNIYILNLNMQGLDDTNLPIILDKVPKNNIILMEDFEIIYDSKKKSSVSEGELTNVLDGIGNPTTEKIVILTTNDSSKVTNRIIRSNRINLSILIDTPSKYLMHKYINNYLDNQIEEKDYKINRELTIQQALEYKLSRLKISDIESILEHLITNKVHLSNKENEFEKYMKSCHSLELEKFEFDFGTTK